ncbi:MAG: GNAT family N-acetyltransferase [Sphingomonadales bacterium]
MQGRITTSRLFLTPVISRDADRLQVLLTAPEVRRFLCDDRILGADEVSGLIEEALALAPQGLGFWIMMAKADGSFVGLAALMPVFAGAAETFPEFAGDIEPTLALAPEAWGQGYAAEALAALMERAADLGLQRLAALVDAPNMRSHRMLERAGFAMIGTTPGPRYTLVAYVADTGRTVSTGSGS